MSEVRAFVEEVGSIINISLEKQEELVKQLDYESISKRWQLKSVSDEQWGSMGAPAGFVTVLQSCLDKHAALELEELKQIINSDVDHVIASQPRERRRLGNRRRLSKANSMSDLDVENADTEASPVGLALRRRNSLGPRQRSFNSGSSLNDLIDLIENKESCNPISKASPIRRDRDTIGDKRRVSKSPEKRRAVIGHDVSDKELDITRKSSLGPRRRKSKSVESLNDVDKRVSKSPERRRAVIGHDVSDKELGIQGQRRSSLGPRRRKSKSVESLNDVDNRVSKSPERRRAVIGHDVSDKELGIQGQRRNSLGPCLRKSKSIEPLDDVESVSCLGNLDSDNEDNNPIALASPGRRPRQSFGARRFSKSPDKRRAVFGHDASHRELDAVERSRLHREQSRRRLLNMNSTSSIVPLNGEDESSVSSSLRRSSRGTNDDEDSIGSRRRVKKGTSEETHGIDRRLKLARGTSSNRVTVGPTLQRSNVLAPHPPSPGGLAQHALLTENDATMKARRRARTKRRGSFGYLRSESQSSRRSFARCQSESPSANRALLGELDLPVPPLFHRSNSAVHQGNSATDSEIAQFQPSLDYAIQNNGLSSYDASTLPEHSFSITKDAESGRFCYLSRGKILYEWNQSFDTMVLLVPKPPEVPEADVVCTIEESSLQLGRKGDKQAFFHRPLGGKCVPEKSIWVQYGGADVKGIIVHLKKANPGEKWPRPLMSVASTKVKKTEHHVRRDSLPEDFGSPRLHKVSLSDAASGSRKRRLSMGQRSSSRGLEILEPEHLKSAVNKKGLNIDYFADLATPQHNASSGHSVDFFLNLPQEEEDDESFWGSSSSLPTLGPSLTDEAHERQGKEEKKKTRRRIKKGNRQNILKAASSMSPFSLKKGILKAEITKPSSVDTADSTRTDAQKEKSMISRASLAGRINTITKGNGAREGLGHSSYQQLDDGDGDDDESVFSSHEENELSPFEPEESEHNSFADQLIAAARLPFETDDNTISTLG